jgi:hypothetical protein
MLDEVRWSLICLGCFTPGKYPVPIIMRLGCLVWTGAKNLAPKRDSIPGLSISVKHAAENEISFLLELLKIRD